MIELSMAVPEHIPGDPRPHTRLHTRGITWQGHRVTKVGAAPRSPGP
jgi:hypothetical protein